jgi:hypothetical protein
VPTSATKEAASLIERDGFRDGRSAFTREGGPFRGVWLADREMTDVFALGGVLFAVELPDDVAEAFEWHDAEHSASPWRAFLVPAEILNQHERERIERGGRS